LGKHKIKFTRLKETFCLLRWNLSIFLGPKMKPSLELYITLILLNTWRHHWPRYWKKTRLVSPKTKPPWSIRSLTWKQFNNKFRDPNIIVKHKGATHHGNLGLKMNKRPLIL
jgi:hypothetical protein